MIVNVEMPDLKELERLLEVPKSKSPVILRAVLNETADRTRTLINRMAAKRYANHKVRDFRNASGIKKKATVSDLCAVLSYTSDNGELYDFGLNDRTYYPASRGGPRQLKGRVLKSAKLSALKLSKGVSDRDRYKAFVIRYKNVSKNGDTSYHVTVGQRVPGKRMKSDPKKEAVKTLFAPSIPKMATAESGVWGDDSLLKEMQDVVNASMVRNISRFMEVKMRIKL